MRDGRWRCTITACVFGLVVMATWTLVVKFLAPVLYSMSEEATLLNESASIMWDFWWVAHFALAYSITHWNKWTYAFASTVSVVEIIIIVIKFYLFFSAPEWTMWRCNWMINKIFVLCCFVLMLAYLVKERSALRSLAR